MDVSILIIFAIVIIPLLVMAAVLLSGRGAFLIAGYNTMSAREKATYNEKALCRSMGKFMLVVTLATVLIPIALLIDQLWLLVVGVALTFVVIIAYLVYVNTGNRFRRTAARTPGSVIGLSTKSLTNKATIIILSVVAGISLLAIVISLSWGSQEPVVTVRKDAIQIEAMYGLTIELAEIQDITLLESRMDDMDVGSRTNGYAANRILKGHFRSDTLGRTLLFVDSRTAPTIWIERQGREDVYISFREGEKTRELYQEMTATGQWGG
jgi:hypothetical protein